MAYESKVLENVVLGIRYEFIYQSINNSYSSTANGEVFLNLNPGRGIVGGYYRHDGASSVPFTNVSYGGLDFRLTAHWTYIGMDYQEVSTTPTHSTLALDNANSPASKWFECLEEGSNGVLAGVYGKELVWDFTADDYTAFTDITMATTMSAYPIGTKVNIVGGELSGYYTVISLYSANTYQTLYDAGNIILDKDGNIVSITASGFSVALARWDGNGFGDNDTFDQLTNGTKTDLNGRTIRTFHGSLPINGRIK